jgi:ABC-type glycerol-3-phosphate transport system permease component
MIVARARPGRRRPTLSAVVPGLVLCVGLLVVFVPLVWAILGSFKSEIEYREIPVHIWPRTWSLESYDAVIRETNLVRGYVNSGIVAILEIGSVLLTSSVAGYVFAQKRFWGKDALFLFVLASTMIPFTMLLIPLYLLFVNSHFSDNYLAVVLPTAVSAYGIFLCRQFIRGIPRDLFEAAVMDGASDVRIYTRIVLPLCRPVLAALAIFTLIQSVNNLLWPLVILSSAELATLPLVLAKVTLVGESIIFTHILAAAVLGSLPLVLLFLILQRNFVKGITLTGITG